MEYQEFVERVGSRISTTQTAGVELAIASTLATLGQRITGGEANDLAAQLPEEMKGSLYARESEEAEEFPLEEFYSRVADQEGVSVEEATGHVAAVMQVLGEAVSAGEAQDVLSQLPAEFEPLLR